MERLDDPCTEPRDGTDPEVYSMELGSGPFSLLIGSPFDAAAPPPTYSSIHHLNRTRPTDKASQTQGYELDKEGGLVCVDERILQNQRGVMTDVIRQVASCLVRGRGIVGLSLPIRLFEPRSTLERMLDRWSYMPTYYQGILECDPLTRFKRTIAMAVGGLFVGPSQEKPFNPLLGETLQASWPDGTEVFCEHTVHHPPITNFYLIGHGFTFSGHLELTGKFKKNSLIGGILGQVNIQFSDGQKVNYDYPEFRAGGMIFGKRTVNWQGEMHFSDPTNHFEAVIVFGPERKKSMFKKAIGKLDDFKGDIKANGAPVAQIEGSWLNQLCIDGEVFWSSEHPPVFHSFPVNPLPSDWRYREDLVWLSKGNSNNAQKWKHKVENRQRLDRKLRGATH